MVDRSGALDRDDAFAVTEVADGSGWRLEVHIAGVADVVPAGSAADATAFLRRESKYLATRTVPMLGRDTERAATLTSDADRATLRVRADLSADGTISDVVVDRGWVPAGRCVPADHAEIARILAAETDPLHETVRAAHRAAQVLLAARRRSGAFALYDLTHGWVSTEEGGLTAIPQAQRTVGYVIVQELMIAANEAIAMWCVQVDLPVLFRNHRSALTGGTGEDLAAEVAVAMTDPVLFEKLRSRLQSSYRAATYAPTVHGHHGLRLAAYTHATSPLRRVSDLITQRVIFAHLDSAPAPYTSEQLGNLAADINRRIAADREEKAAHFKARDRKVTAQVVAAGELEGLDSKRWAKVLTAATARDPIGDVVSELRRRVQTDDVTVTTIVTLLEAGENWAPIRREVFDWASQTHPEFGPSVVSMWLQAHPDLPRPEIDGDHRGPSHTPVFAARFRAGQVRGPWATAGSKKRAEQDAAWGWVRAAAAGESHPDTESPLTDPEPSAAPGDTAAAPSTEPGEVAAASRNRAVPPPNAPRASEVVAKKRARARKNPIAWVLSHAQHHGHPSPRWEITVDGPPHAPEFTCEVRYLDNVATGRGNTKTLAKARAAEHLVDALLDETTAARLGT
ncbi:MULTISPECIES: RNB domain-containing ribonuclease [Rhodococcus]|uniref:Exoribonuclease II n=1 Tax=Rhodococcus opacus RKJ300 = JCM 13270 TaxID=1165867 RepID=I0WYV2_RHOOP|nr:MULTISPECIES: RNB domain-containing ribonuclease [Rhodococcus]EID81568.1 exoribonuclease II [Rhodococcus opacus RKJ300 = JCM 13270]QQZ19717.1 RNB domain-containing ribonuclease [Rhodococcus sp. 21391]